MATEHDPSSSAFVAVKGKTYSCPITWRDPTYGGARQPLPKVVVVNVTDETTVIYPLEHHVHHSPDGHAWGYGGSGPSELAKDILWDLLGKRPEPDVYHPFKEAFIVPLDQEKGFVLTERDIRGWLRARAALLPPPDAEPTRESTEP